MTYDSMGSAETTIIGDSGSSLGRIDQYELVCELGGGGFGTVYLAKDTVSGIDVAVKGLPPLVRNSREEMENIRSNFALVSRLTHTNIAKALVLHPAKSVAYASEDVRGKLRVDSGDTLMVMEYAPGVTLSQWRKQFPDRKVPVAKALEITRQIASALDYAHDRRIVHRDIKPANVMIETAEDGAVTARVLDFGLAAEIRTSMGRMSLEIRDKSGTRPYMAPEQWLGGKQGPATDQYALAVLFNELVTGEVPFASVFETGDPVVMMNVVGREPFSPSNELPKAVRNALARALAKKPEERFASCRDFVAALEGNRSSRAEHVERVGGAAAKWLLAAAALAVLAAGGYFGWVKYDEGVKAREAEAKRIKQEVYELKGKASQARDKNEKEEWRNWPHFDQKAKELEGAFRAGEAAFAKDDFEVARTLFLKVRDNWYWLSSNKVERAKAIAAKAKAEADWRNAEYAKAGELSSKEFAVATNGFASAVSAFDAGAFHASGEEFVKAGKAFENAKAKANAESDRLIAERKKADTDAALAAFRSSPPRYEEGFRLSRTADRDNATIQFYIGVCYDFGYGGAEQDDRMAAEWYRKAAEQGEMTAQFNLGLSYAKGQGVIKNEAEAVKWYRMAAEQGYASAQFNLALCYRDGRGVVKDDAEAVKWYRKAAEQGDADAQNNLGFMYETGRGVAKDCSEAVKWYRKAAEQGDAKGEFNLGVMYENGDGVGKDEAEAVKWYSRAAENGYAKAQREMGWRCQNGNGVGKDLGLAVEWYRKAAEQGYSVAQFDMGVMYANGWGVAKDDVEAVKWYLKAAELGYVGAQYNLALRYDNGQGVTKDEAEAVKWYRRAAEQGQAGAQNNLGLMCETGRGVAKDYSEAVKWYRKAAEQGDAKGEFNLGDMYEYGKGVEKNLTMAMELYRKAAAKGDDSAKKRLASLADAIAITTSGAETRYREGLEMLGIDIESTFRYGSAVRVAPGDNLPDILNNCNDKTTIILSPGEYKGNGSVFMNSKSVRIRGGGDGVFLKKIQFHLDGKGDDGILLVVENLTFIDGDSKYGVWVQGKARCVVDKCVFKRCGVWIGDYNGTSCMSVTRSCIERHQSRGVTCCKATRLYMADSTVLSNSVKDYPVIAHDNSRFVIRNSVIKTDDENVDGIFAIYTGVLFCIENTSFEGFRYGIKTGKNSTGSVIRCKFKDMLDCAIDNSGQIQTYLNTFSGTAKKFALDSAVRESSSSITINKNMLR